MRFDRKLAVPDGYELAFKQANAIFHHARVYDASSRKLSFLKPLPAFFVEGFNGDLDFLGPDLPPSRALAIAQGRLDPISMCAFDEFARVDHPNALQKAHADAPSAHESMQGIVRLETDEELFATLAASVSWSPSNGSALKPDNGFLAHLKLVACSSSSSTVWPCLDEEQPSCGPTCDLRTVTQSPGKKRVLPPPPNNNPFKKGRLVEKSATCSSEGHFLFNSELDGQLFSSAKSLDADKAMAAQALMATEMAKSQQAEPTSLQAECCKTQASMQQQEYLKAQATISYQPTVAEADNTVAEAGNGGSPKTPPAAKQQREAKAKKATKSSGLRQSKVVAASSMAPSLLKFFQRAPAAHPLI